MSSFIKIAWRNIFRNWRRSLFTIAAISVGLAALIFIWGFMDGTNEQMIDNSTSYLSGHLQIHKKGFHKDMSIFFALDNPQAVLSKLPALKEIKNYAQRIEGQALFSAGEKTAGAVLVGVEPEKEIKVTTLWQAVKTGRYLEPADTSAIVIGSALAERLKISLGGEVAVLTQAADGSLGAAKYKVAGIYSTGTDTFDGVYAFITLPAAQDLYALWGRSTGIVMTAQNRSVVPRLKKSLAGELDSQRFEVLDWWALIPEIAMSFVLHEVSASIILTVVFLIVAIGILNTILMSVVERVREFGVMMALGTNGRQVVLLVILESILLGAVGILIGGGLGVLLTLLTGRTGLDFSRYGKAMEVMPGIGAVIYPIVRLDRLAFLAILIFFFAVLAAVSPAIKAARLKPVAAIRHMETV